MRQYKTVSTKQDKFRAGDNIMVEQDESSELWNLGSPLALLAPWHKYKPTLLTIIMDNIVNKLV